MVPDFCRPQIVKEKEEDLGYAEGIVLTRETSQAGLRNHQKWVPLLVLLVPHILCRICHGKSFCFQTIVWNVWQFHISKIGTCSLLEVISAGKEVA